MTTVIEVAPLTGRQPHSFGHLRLYHRGCEGVPLIQHRNPLTEQCTLQCVCGLTIRMPVRGPAVESFEQTAIDHQPRTVPSGTYASTAGAELLVDTKGVGSHASDRADGSA